MSSQYLEVELRYQVHDVDECLKRLADAKITPKHTERLIDEWYLPKTIKNLGEEQEWFDENHGIAWRIRRAEKDGKTVLDVTSKQLTDDNNHNSFHETTASFDSYEAAVRAQQERDYKNWLTIDKTRRTFKSANPQVSNDEFELVLDHVAGLAEKIGVGACLEIEYKGTATRAEALERISKVAVMLGFSEADQFEKSLTVESMTALAHF